MLRGWSLWLQHEWLSHSVFWAFPPDFGGSIPYRPPTSQELHSEWSPSCPIFFSLPAHMQAIQCSQIGANRTRIYPFTFFNGMDVRHWRSHSEKGCGNWLDYAAGHVLTHIYSDSADSVFKIKVQSISSWCKAPSNVKVRATTDTSIVHPGHRCCRLHIWNIFTAQKS